jgi:hypothetical protein
MFKEIYNFVIMGLGSNDCFCDRHTIHEWGHGYSFASRVGDPKSNSIGLLEYDGMRTISETTTTLLGNG